MNCTLCRWGNSAGAQLEYQLVATFLTSVQLAEIRRALDFIHDIE